MDSGANFTGGVGNDTFTGTIDTTNTPSTATWTALDAIDGGDGVDTFNIQALTDFAVPGGATVSNVETVAVTAAAKFGTFAANGTGALDVSTVFSGVKTLTVSNASQADFKAPSSVAVTVSNVTGGVEVVGGASQTVSLSAQAGNVKVSGSTGAISVTSTAQAANTITVDGGSTVAVNTTSTATNGAIIVGGTTASSGAVTVTSALNGDGTASIDQADVTVTGGTTVTVNSTVTIAAKDETAGAAHTLGDVAVNGNGKTTTVTVNQTYAETEFTKAAVAVVKETHAVKFVALAANGTAVVDGLTFTASKALTAAEVAQAFANLTAADRQAPGGKVANGVFTGVLSANFTSGVASGDTVVFTAKDDSEALALTGPTETVTAGSAASGAVTSTNSITYGKVTIDDAATAAITSATVNGFGAGSTITDSSALATLSLSKAATADMVVADTADTLALTVSALGSAAGDAVVTLTAAPLTLNVTSTGNNYVNLTAAATKTLTVAGTGVFDADPTDLAALETVTVTGTAGLKLNAAVANTLKSVDTSATTGAVTLTLDGGVGTYTGGAGVDTVTLATTTALTKAINLGAGDDTLSFAALNVTGSTAAVNGGDGTDTLSMAVATADALDASAQTFYTNFERLTLNDAAGDNDDTADTVTIDLANLGFTNYVTTSGTVLDKTTATKSDTLVLNNLASGGTVVFTASAAGANTKQTIQIKDAATGTADVLNVVAKITTAGIDYGTLTAANTETVNLTSTDATLDNNADGVDDAVDTVTLIVTADKATTLNVAGNANSTLTLTGSNALTTVDASTATGALTVNANTTLALTVKGGSGADQLTATGSGDTLIGGAGNDTLTGASLTTLTGGAGNDIFKFAVPTNVNSYATITDAASGDTIDLDAANAGTVVFTKSAIVLGDTAVFQDYANAAVNALGTDTNDAAWFQFNGNTYIVQSGRDHSGAGTPDFGNGVDSIVKLTGLVDLSTASYNQSIGTLEIA